MLVEFTFRKDRRHIVAISQTYVNIKFQDFGQNTAYLFHPKSHCLFLCRKRGGGCTSIQKEAKNYQAKILYLCWRITCRSAFWLAWPTLTNVYVPWAAYKIHNIGCVCVCMCVINNVTVYDLVGLPHVVHGMQAGHVWFRWWQGRGFGRRLQFPDIGRGDLHPGNTWIYI